MSAQHASGPVGAKSRLIYASGLGMGLAVAVALHFVTHAGAQSEKGGARGGARVAELEKQVATLKTQLTTQSTAMLGVSEHYLNLWHAVQAKNWPLAEFYCEETEESIEWAITLEPVHKNSQNEDVVLPGIWGGVKESLFEPLEKAVKAKDPVVFEKAYKAMMEGCYSCHKAVEKPFLRPGIPQGRPHSMINFDPDAKWPD